MRTAVLALTKNGIELAARVGRALDADIYIKNEYMDKVIFNGELVMVHPYSLNFTGLISKIFFQYEALIFIMACGIVVRSIAPYIKDKREDPAVVVVDEAGRYAISLLSGHIGGANRLAGKVASVLGGIPVITTATDINGMVAFDELAKDNHCEIENIQVLKHISAELVNGGRISLFYECRLNGVLPSNILPYSPGNGCRRVVAVSNSDRIPAEGDTVLYIRPKNLFLGIGCKKGKSKEEIRKAVEEFLQKNNKSIFSVRCVSSIDLKADEKGILDFCSEKGIPFKTHSVEEIQKVEHRFGQSEFVKRITGTGNVCEACAALCGDNARIICPKTAYDGITLALAEEEFVFTL